MEVYNTVGNRYKYKYSSSHDDDKLAHKNYDFMHNLYYLWSAN